VRSASRLLARRTDIGSVDGAEFLQLYLCLYLCMCGRTHW
jgi:hypothetical protein